MRVFKLNHVANGYASIDMEFEVISILQKKSWEDLNNLRDKDFPLIIEQEDKIGECPFYIGVLPIFSERIVNELVCEKWLDNSICHIPITIDKSYYEIVYTDKLLDDIINIKRSKITKFPDGRIMSIEKYIFNKTEFPQMFRLKEYPLHTFVNEDIANILYKMNIEDLILEEIVTI